MEKKKEVGPADPAESQQVFGRSEYAKKDFWDSRFKE